MTMAVSRQLRLYDPVLLRERLPKLIGKKINIVLRDSRVVHGELVAASDREIVIKNMRLSQQPISISSISEVYFDTVATC